MSDDAAKTDADDGDEADRHGTEHDCLKDARMAERRLEVLAGQDLLAESKADDIAHQRDWEHQCGGGRGFGPERESPAGHRSEGAADHACGVLRGHRPHRERPEQYGGDVGLERIGGLLTVVSKPAGITGTRSKHRPQEDAGT